MATSIDVKKVTERLARRGPLERIKGAEFQGQLARELIGYFAEMRREAVAEAHVQGLETGLSEQSVRHALRQDKELLRAALEVLARPGVSSVPAGSLERAFRPRASLETIALRVRAAVEAADTDKIPADHRASIAWAFERAGRLLGLPAGAE
jgi:hypothetical protein